MQKDHNNGNNMTDILAAAASPLPSNAADWYQEEYEEGIDLRDYWYVLKKRKWWVLGITGGAVLIAILLSLFMTPVWQGQVTLQITREKGASPLGALSGLNPLGVIMGSSSSDRFFNTQMAILKSPAMAYGLIDALKLQNYPSYKRMIKQNPDDPPGVIRQKYAQALLKHLKVEPVANSYLVNVLFRSTNKELAQKVPEAMQDVYINLTMKTRQQSFVKLEEWLNRQLAKLGSKLETSEKETISAGQKGESMGIGLSDKMAKENVVLLKYVQVSQLLTKAQSVLAAKKALYEQIKQKGADAPVIVNNRLIQTLRGQLIAAEGNAAGSAQVYGPRFPGQKINLATINTLKRKLRGAVRQQVISIRSDYQAALKTEKLLQQEFDNARVKMAGMENGLVKYHMLERDLKSNQALYLGLLGRMKETALTATRVPSNIAVINPSEEPYMPWMPKPALFVALALVLGAVIGVGSAFLLEYLDSSIKTAEELEKISRVPSLGIIPMIENGAVPKTALETISHFDPKSQISEAVSHIRSAIMLSSSSSPPQMIVVTSCNPAEGKSTVTCNMAIALSRGQRKCVVIDCDLRKPSLHRVFNQSNRQGLTNLLTGSATLEEITRATGIPELYFIPAGPTPPNPGDLISSEAFRKMIETLRQQYQHIVIDSPPVIGFADARFLAALSDGAVLVLKHLSTTREAAKLAVQMLSCNNSQILGSVLTMVNKDQLGYGAYYDYYKHYSKRYESYRDSDGEPLKEIASAHSGKDREE